MIFGKTRQRIKDGFIWFAWYPVPLEDGRWAWLEKLWCYGLYDKERIYFIYRKLSI